MITIVLKFLKVAWPFLLAGAVYYIAFLQGSAHGLQKANKQFTEQVMKLDKKKCPDCRCPKYEPCPPAIDYDKMKARNIQVTVHQHNTVQMNADSLYFIKLEQLIGKKLNELEVVRTKRR
jgi:hypothetical protein